MTPGLWLCRPTPGDKALTQVALLQLTVIGNADIVQLGLIDAVHELVIGSINITTLHLPDAAPGHALDIVV